MPTSGLAAPNSAACRVSVLYRNRFPVGKLPWRRDDTGSIHAGPSLYGAGIPPPYASSRSPDHGQPRTAVQTSTPRRRRRAGSTVLDAWHPKCGRRERHPGHRVAPLPRKAASWCRPPAADSGCEPSENGRTRAGHRRPRLDTLLAPASMRRTLDTEVPFWRVRHGRGSVVRA